MDLAVKERLIRYMWIKMENENRLEKLIRMKNAAAMPEVAGADGTSANRTDKERMAKAVEAYVTYESQIMPVVERNRQEMAILEAAVEELPDPIGREVLRLRYIDGSGVRRLSWKEIAYRVFGSCDTSAQRRATRVHRHAIAQIKMN